MPVGRTASGTAENGQIMLPAGNIEPAGHLAGGNGNLWPTTNRGCEARDSTNESISCRLLLAHPPLLRRFADE